MTFNDAKSIIDRISYKSNYKIDLRRMLDIDDIELIISHLSPNSDTLSPDLLVHVAGAYYISGYTFIRLSENELISIVKEQLKEIEHHEFKEWFRLDGKCLDDPHPGYEIRVSKFL